MTDEELMECQRLAETQERERREAEQAARAERRLQAELNRPPPPIDWRRFSKTSEMNSHEFSEWCDRGKPKLGIPKSATPAPPPAPALDVKGLSAGIARGVAEACSERLDKLERENADLQRRMGVLEGALIQRGLSSSDPIDLPRLPRLNGRDAH